MSYFSPQHLQELILSFQYLLCGTVWEPRIYSLAALLSIPLIGNALAAEQLITDMIDRDVAHNLSDLCGRNFNEVKSLAARLSHLYPLQIEVPPGCGQKGGDSWPFSHNG